MNRLLLILAILVSLGNAVIAGDSNKSLVAVRTPTPPKIDGILDDDVWKLAVIVDDFVMNEPTEGMKPTYKTVVRLLYDDDAIYVSAMLYDAHPDSIMHELGNRDDDLNADEFRLLFDTYNKHQDAFEFDVWASGVQGDLKFSDATFNAVWESAVKIGTEGWSLEIRIPYSAIRFPKTNEQTWAVQFTRSIRRSREFDQWCLTPKGKPNSLNYWGLMTGITDIHAPLRLSLTPYIAAYLDNTPVYDENNKLVYTKSFSYAGGADIKYGIDRRFTLDMTLLPDFGQVQSDNRVKNLTPFEIVFDENRPFFKEGFDLFGKDGVFYSRRIGRTPTQYSDVANNLLPGETILSNPSQTKLLNATKVSGRTDKGLGIGIFNAVTDNMYATVQDSIGNKRRILTEPLADYTVFVLDQNLKNNADIYFINGNTLRSKGFGNANVSDVGFSFQNKNNTLEWRGGTTVTQRYGAIDSLQNKSKDDVGKQYSLLFHKISGDFRYSVSTEATTPNFNRNDLGVSRYTNYQSYETTIEYNKYQPFWICKETYNNITITKVENYTTRQQESVNINFNSFTVMRSHWGWDFGGGFTPVTGLDFYEPRIEGKYYRTPKYLYFYGSGSSPYNKRIACDFGVRYNQAAATNSRSFGYSISPIIKFSDKLSLRHTTDFDHYSNDLGYANFDANGSSIFGSRDIYTVVNTLSLKYIFKNDMSLSLRGRHYLSNGVYHRYYSLLDDGTLLANDAYSGMNNFNSNFFNIDLVYSWQFSPGSTMNIVYKNAIDREDIVGNADYYPNLHNALNSPQTNSISIKVLYYLDYQYLLKSRTKTK